jgi:hypothetical protein
VNGSEQGLGFAATLTVHSARHWQGRPKRSLYARFPGVSQKNEPPASARGWHFSLLASGSLAPECRDSDGMHIHVQKVCVPGMACCQKRSSVCKDLYRLGPACIRLRTSIVYIRVKK